MTPPDDTQRRRAEVAEKVGRVRRLLEERDLDGALLTRQALLGWITAGMEDMILRGADPAFVWGLVTRDGCYLLTSSVEAARLAAEEAPEALGFELVHQPWYDGHHEALVAGLCDPGRLINDGSGPGADGAADLQEIRLSLTGGERERIRALGGESAAAVEQALRAMVPGMSEAELCAEIAARFERARIFGSAILIGSDGRRSDWRHPTVSSKSIERDALVVIVGVRGGLNVALTRTASFDEPDAELLRRHLVAGEAEARAMQASRPGVPYAVPLAAMSQTYARHGFPEEWREHTQGGPIGYAGREFVPGPAERPDANTRRPIRLHTAIAYNPTVQGAKTEDTFLVAEDGPDVLTVTADWPSISVPVEDGRAERPAIAVIGR